MIRTANFILAMLLALAVQSTFAGPEQTIKEALQVIAPEIKIERIHPTPIKGLYEVTIGSQLMYVTADGRYFIDGRIVDLKTRSDLTETRLTETRKNLLESIPESQMIIFDAPKTSHTITVFTDIECGYCRKLHRQIKEYGAKGIRVRYLFFPRAGKDSAAYDEAVSVWCAGDAKARQAAMTAAKGGETITHKTCDNPIDLHMKLGEQMGLRGTPAILTEDGDLIPGYVEPNELAAQLANDGNDEHKDLSPR